ncbi:flavodoxin family protein [Gordonibacter sp.]|uniref:flavodoxin family protein n=1 Tax=Gordonibacter sp. TaxID=1968902 RepID=UPI002FCAD461
MHILAINGSHRAGKGTAALLQAALEQAAACGAETELVELARLDIGYCAGCNACLAKPTCTLSDDMDGLVEKMRVADGIILGSPDYFANVSARMKTFIDRTRPLHMAENVLKGKVGGMVSTSGLDNCGAEETMGVMDRFFAVHEMLVVHPRPAGPVLANGATGSQFAGFDERGRVQWRRVEDDTTAFAFARQLGVDMAELVRRLVEK